MIQSVRSWAFEAAVGFGSQLLVVRDRALGRLSPVDPGCRVNIPSGGHELDAAFYQPEGATAAILICHGIGETVEHWPRAQHLLASKGLASLVFNYSGFGRSGGRVSAAQCERDALSAYQWLRARVGNLPVFLLGFSLGTGVATAVAGKLEVSGLILCEAYTSFREAAARMGLPGTLFHDVWPSVRTITECNLPVLVVHGDADRLFPVSMAESLAAACDGTLCVVKGMGHADLHARARPSDWQFVVDWVQLTQTKV